MADRYEVRSDEDGFYIYDTEDCKRLLGWYTYSVAEKTAKRMNMDFAPSAGLARALRTLAAVRKLTLHQFYEQFRGKVYVGDCRQLAINQIAHLEKHGLARREGDEVYITEWGLDWLGAK